ncbi:uncharacterized protein JN550_004850 [Neoarthrinium moseri]|uniref:uncharacterized protein n=1 Tax=Neoarthrinium moseri TaxID=1658444 RepID=UPI001FDB3AA8|nr:uncharacterized protein JN550_004850 [Neoarthrinium moseri]KAI1870704.1 hypothetical protein JN550_004850 [Neoarthrinium moseri]
MYDDPDYPSRDRDQYRRRSPSSRDQPHRPRHDSSRSPGRNRADDPRRPDRHHAYSDQNHGGRYDRDRSDAYRRRESPGYGRDARSPDHHRGRDYRGDRGQRSPRDHSPYASPDDDGYYREGGYRSGPGRPHHTLKLDDVPGSMSAQEVEDALWDLGAKDLVELRLKSDDRSGDRRCYAFAEFRTDEDAIDFLERYYPTLQLTATDGSRARVPIAYSRDRRPPPKSDDWQCTMCHFENFSRRATCKQCKAPRSSENVAEMQLDGISDECPQQAPSQFLVVRNLPPSVSETTLATGIKKLYVAKEDEPKQPAGAPTKLKSTVPVGNTSGLGAKAGSLARVFVIRDRQSDVTCRYGFAEFSSLDDARAAMAKFNASPQFTIGSKPVSIAYIHSGVFIPYLKPASEQDSRFTFVATHNPSLRLSYWNPTVYASELTVFNEGLYEEATVEKAATDQSSSAAKDSKKRKADRELAAPGGKKTIAMAPQLAMWANKHAELRGGHKNSNQSSVDEKKPPVTGPNSLGAVSDLSVSSAPQTVTTSYADLDKLCCLLCRRKFISEPSLRRHEHLSDLHKKNLEDDALIEKATRDLKALGKEPVSNYRDRAKERRTAYQQPNKPKPHVPRKPKQPSKENDHTAPSKPAISKGAGLLAKMGWNSGSGLGAEGEGRTKIIETMAYTPGVGLGAEGGKIGDAAEEAARNTKNDYSDFVAKAKDKARQRYEQMG